MNRTSTVPASASTKLEQDAEALRTLRDMARGKVNAVPPEALAQHVLDVTVGADWPVRCAAMEALLRRASVGRRDELRVASRPRGKAVFGVYATKGADQGARPYRTLLTSLVPLCGSCDCRDFVRNGLGLCKHLLVALSHCRRKARRAPSKRTTAGRGRSVGRSSGGAVGESRSFQKARSRVNRSPRIRSRCHEAKSAYWISRDGSCGSAPRA